MNRLLNGYNQNNISQRGIASAGNMLIALMWKDIEAKISTSSGDLMSDSGDTLW